MIFYCSHGLSVLYMVHERNKCLFGHDHDYLPLSLLSRGHDKNRISRKRVFLFLILTLATLALFESYI